MSDIAIKFENISKQYRLGKIGTGTLSHDLKRWWTVNVRRQEDPYIKIGSLNDRSIKADSEYVWALRDINLEVKQGEVLGIIGKNGAGKSTLLKLLSRVTTPTTGRIMAKGRIASLLEVGTGFHPEMTGRENVYMNGSIMGMTKTEITGKFDEIVDFAGVTKYIDTPVKRYSSGMTVRLGFAIAAHLEPEILVVDEVLAVGDAEFQKKAVGKMQDVSKTHGRTVLFVSHNMGAISSLTQRCICLKDGFVFDEGLTAEVIDKYLSDSSKDEVFEGLKIISNPVITVSRNGDKRKKSIISFGCDVDFHGSFVSKVSMHEVSLFMKVVDAKGDIISTINSRDSGVLLSLKEQKQTSFIFTIERINLIPGKYFITFALHNSFIETIEEIPNITAFEVTTENAPGRLNKASAPIWAGKTYFFGRWNLIS